MKLPPELLKTRKVPPKLWRKEEICSGTAKRNKEKWFQTAEHEEFLLPKLHKTREVAPELPRNKKKWLYNRKK
jgi:hypothetical protein